MRANMGVMRTVPAWPFLGREDALVTLTTALADPAVDGVVAVGPAGVGRSRLLDEASATLLDRGAVVHRIVATRANRATRWAACAELLPAIVGRNPTNLDVLRHTGPALASQAGGRPVVITVDDAQWLDGGSAGLLAHVARNGVFVVLGLRSSDRLPPALATLWRQSHLVERELCPLPLAVMEMLLTVALGGPVDPAGRHDLLRLAGGDLTLLRALVETCLAAGNLVLVDGLWRWSGQLAWAPRLRAVVEAQLGSVDPALQPVVELLAVAGQLETEVAAAMVDPALLA
ncbi:MAG: AAA family ATPase, partial [Acidimicrobiales bacterium]